MIRSWPDQELGEAFLAEERTSGKALPQECAWQLEGKEKADTA